MPDRSSLAVLSNLLGQFTMSPSVFYVPFGLPFGLQQRRAMPRFLVQIVKDSAGMNTCGKTGKLEKMGGDVALSRNPLRKVENFGVPLSASARAV